MKRFKEAILRWLGAVDMQEFDLMVQTNSGLAKTLIEQADKIQELDRKASLMLKATTDLTMGCISLSQATDNNTTSINTTLDITHTIDETIMLLHQRLQMLEGIDPAPTMQTPKNSIN